MDLIIERARMSEGQLKRTTENLEVMAAFFEDIVSSITASAPNYLEEVFVFKRGEKSLTLRGEGNKFDGGFLVVDVPKKKEKKKKKSSIKIV
jgi:hypothetical protein